MTNLTPEMIQKAKAVKTAEELLALAKENGIEMTEEEAKAYFAQLHSASGEITDDELDNVAGGGCYSGDRLVVTVAHMCDLWTCKKCGRGCYGDFGTHFCKKGFWSTGDSCEVVCNSCKHMSYEKGLWLCNHPDKRK